MVKKEKQIDAYWMKETPTDVIAGKMRLRYFPKAGKLQVTIIYQNRIGGIKTDRIITLDRDIMRRDDMAALKLLQIVVNDWIKMNEE